MTRIVHLSDLHYGTQIAAVEAALRVELADNAYDLIVISGDMTQRARRSQFRRARSFLAAYPGPKLIVPGNHDMPLYDLPRRFVGALGRYRHYICDTLHPFYRDESIAVLGITTGRPYLWTEGTINRRQIDYLRERLAAEGDRIRVLVTHHPLFAPPERGHRLHRWAQRLMSGLGELRPDLVLSGHLHVSYTLDVPVANPEFAGRTLSVQAGTVISNRQRGEPNAYNRVDVDGEHATVEVRGFDGSGFTTRRRLNYRRKDQRWIST